MKIFLLADINSSHTRKWVKGFLQNGLLVRVFSMSAPREDWFTAVDVQCVYFGADPNLQDKQSALAKLSYLKAVKRVKKEIKTFSPDIVHAHYATSYGLLGALSGFKNYLISVWGSDIQDFPYRSFLHKSIMKFILGKAKVVCSTSDAMLKDINYVGKYRTEKVSFGIVIDEFQSKFHSEKDELVFGTVKTMDTVYGIDHLLKSFAKYIKKTNRKDKLFLYGKGPQTDNLKSLTQELGITHLVDYKGYVNRKNISEAYNSLDVYLSLSRRESYGVAALEASAVGLPLITSKADGFFEVVNDGITGFRIDAENYDSVAEKMISLQDVSLRKKMGEQGMEWVKSNFNFSNDIKKQIALYASLLDEKVV